MSHISVWLLSNQRTIARSDRGQALLHVSMASNYYNSDTGKIMIKYPNAVTAKEAMYQLADKINDCHHDAKKKHIGKK